MNIKLESTPAMKRFNKAVAMADYFLGPAADQFGTTSLCAILRARGYPMSARDLEKSQAEIELERASAALNGGAW
jgi:hypothetical protein